jgi:hypothetical protein
MRLLPLILFTLGCAVAAAQSVGDQASFIDQVQEQAQTYDTTLPDFICTQETRRSSQSNKPGAPWKLLDTLTIRLSYFGRKEDYRVVKVNGKPADKTMSEMKGSKTLGDFGSLLRAVFRPKSETKFEWLREDEWNGRKVGVLAFHIDQEHSGFQTGTQVHSRKLSVNWAAQGTIFADVETRQVLRLTVDSVDLPEDFPVREVHMSLDYATQQIGDRAYVLPAASVSESVDKEGRRKSETTFKDYKKFSAETEIKFGETDKF